MGGFQVLPPRTPGFYPEGMPPRMNTSTATKVGYTTEHGVHTGGGRSDVPDAKWQATCETCGWVGTKAPRSEAGWQLAAAEVRQHREASRTWVPVEAIEEPGTVYICQELDYDTTDICGVYNSLYVALVANPVPWRMESGDSWIRDDGDAMTITRWKIEGGGYR